jgi:hypothetical protein
MPDVLQIPADLTLLLRQMALEEYSLACETAHREVSLIDEAVERIAQFDSGAPSEDEILDAADRIRRLRELRTEPEAVRA